ncbi:response regulator, partial [Methylobacterium isbiliense]
SQVYGFATQSGGTATVASQPGRGTTVTLYLPRTTEPIQPASDNRQQAEVVRRRKDLGRILLVDGNVDVAEITRSYLEEFGYSVVKAHRVETALEILRASNDISIVLSDIVMPGQQNGLDLARYVRKEYAGRVNVLLATGYSDVAQAAASEGFPILRKPFNSQQMEDALDRARPHVVLRVVS